MSIILEVSDRWTAAGTFARVSRLDGRLDLDDPLRGNAVVLRSAPLALCEEPKEVHAPSSHAVGTSSVAECEQP
jgi:hypothetical protein